MSYDFWENSCRKTIVKQSLFFKQLLKTHAVLDRRGIFSSQSVQFVALLQTLGGGACSKHSITCQADYVLLWLRISKEEFVQ